MVFEIQLFIQTHNETTKFYNVLLVFNCNHDYKEFVISSKMLLKLDKKIN